MRWQSAWWIVPLVLAATVPAEERDARLIAIDRARALAAAAPVPAPAVAAPGPVAVGPIAIGAVAWARPATTAVEPLVPRGARIEWSFPLAAQTGTAPFEPDPVQGGIDIQVAFRGPVGTTTVPAFWDGSTWRVRFCPGDPGRWTAEITAIDASGTATAAGPAFQADDRPWPGFVRIAGSRLVTAADGRPWTGIGHNTGWQYDVEQPALATLAAAGGNALSFWIATPWVAGGDRVPIEGGYGGIGMYQQAPCVYLDGVIDRAEAAGVRLIPSLWAHDQLRDTGHPWGTGSWSNQAYASICSASAFVVMESGGVVTPQWRRQRNLYRYLCARYAASPAIAAWVGVVEIEGTNAWRSDATATGRWCEAVRDQFALHDPYRNGPDGYPMTFTRSDTGGSSALAFGASAPAFALRAADSYAKKTDNTGIAAHIAAGVATMAAGGRPRFHTEFGADTTAGGQEPRHYHNGIWAGMAAGSTLVPMRWCDDGAYPMLGASGGTTGLALQDHLGWLAAFLAKAEPIGRADLALSASAPTGIRAWGMADGGRGWTWIQATSGGLAGRRVDLSPLRSGRWRASWYRTWGPAPVPVAEVDLVAAEGSLGLDLPALSPADPDLACILTCLDEAPVLFRPAVADPTDLWLPEP